MVAKDAQNETSGTWTAEENNKLESDQGSDSGVRPTSSGVGGEPIGAGGDAGEEKIVLQPLRGTISGGILCQLIEETQNQLEKAKREVIRLEELLNKLIQLFKELTAKTGKTLD